MEKWISLCEEKYFYSCTHNVLINKEIKTLFLENAKNYEVPFKNVNVNKENIDAETKNINRLLFEVTQDCNLKCKYCVYRISPSQRKPSKKYLDFETAKKAIDYIYTKIHRQNSNDFLVGFYGGEPLLNFSLIKKIVAYTKLLFKNRKIRFNITTNGTLLNLDIMNFFISNNFQVLVSLDGPIQIHDHKRIFLGGKGSFKLITENLIMIKSKNKNFYNNNIRFSITWSYDSSLEKVYNFFTNNDLVNKNRVVFAIVREKYFYKKFPYSKYRVNKAYIPHFESVHFSN